MADHRERGLLVRVVHDQSAPRLLHDDEFRLGLRPESGHPCEFTMPSSNVSINGRVQDAVRITGSSPAAPPADRARRKGATLISKDLIVEVPTLAPGRPSALAPESARIRQTL